MKVVIAGGGGFLGRALIEELSVLKAEVVILSRSDTAVPKARVVRWDGKTVGAWSSELEGATAVVNFSGSPIFSRWSSAGRNRILESRVQSTRALGSAIAASKRPPEVWINGSATGFYGSQGRRELAETTEAGDGFLADVCKAWEAATTESQLTDTRVVILRTGVVLDRDHPPLSLLLKLTKLFLGGCVGNGHAYVPWIHVIDHARLVRFCIEHDLSGPVNVVAPEPVTNGELMVLIRHELRRPWSPPVPAVLFNLLAAFGFPSEAVLGSTRAIPVAAEAAGFRWICPKPASALQKLPPNRKGKG